MNTPATITIAHRGTTITYNESENRWAFTLRGRDRSAESLAKAKEYIDKPVPFGEKAKPFEKIPAWYFPYNDTPKKAEVTGIAEKGYSCEEVWITCEGKRSKQRVLDRIYPANEKNDALVQQIITAQQEIVNLRKSIYESTRHLAPLVLPKDE